ncbi:DNA polymerase [Polyangium aurulentum]|uniref:DNA polymerase n=1 Tax=Polyangium aurulentum TaxID=2567896 RepID=UPI00200D8714|nr:DNA polymerase [Polyangium aurulentum]UQA57141.1 hypothetical protein E8A73_038500 [Polyangium aurulentum]
MQRICALGPQSLPDRLVIDVGAVLRWASESDIDDALDALVEAAGRTRRHTLWAITPTPLSAVDATELDAATTSLEKVFGAESVLRSDEPLTSLLTTSVQGPIEAGIVTAGLDDRPYELWITARGVTMLDVATGHVWTHDRATKAFLPPALLPELYAILGSPLDGKAYVKANQFAERFKAALQAGQPPEMAANLPPALRVAIQNKKSLIDGLARSMRGQDGPVDSAARASLAGFVCPASIVPVGRTDTAYVVVDVGDGARPVDVHVQIGPTQLKGQGAAGEQLLRQAHAAIPGRWFIPRALDALDYMVDQGLPLPASAVDPGLIAYALHPDTPERLVDLSMSAAPLPTPLLSWLADPKRKLTSPAPLDPLAAVLPRLDQDLAVQLEHHGLVQLIEDDLALTLPHLARLEREGGAWVGTPASYASWEQFHDALEDELGLHEQVFAQFLTIDPYTATTLELLQALKGSRRPLPKVPFAHELKAKEEFARLVAANCTEAVLLDRARALQSASGAYFWLKRLQGGLSRLRGRQIPLATGRWGYRSLPLHNLPKRSPEGREIRSGLLGPPGHVLVAADYNGFEVRLLAALSRDSILENAAQHDDIHTELADTFFSSRSKEDRERAKLGVYSIVYGQTASSFWKARPEMARADADALYTLVQARLTRAMEYREQVWHQYIRDRFVTTSGGWRRIAPTRRKAFNTVLQGLGADVLRWVLRHLGRELPVVKARVVHQAHDELIVAALPEQASEAERILQDTMTRAVVQESNLLPAHTQLRVNVRRGKTWGDLI